MATFRLQTNRQIEKYNETLVSPLRLYITEDQSNYDILVPTLKYEYSCQVYSSTVDNSFNLALSGRSFGPTTVVSLSTLPDNAGNAKSLELLQQKTLHLFSTMQDKVSNNLTENKISKGVL